LLPQSQQTHTHQFTIIRLYRFRRHNLVSEWFIYSLYLSYSHKTKCLQQLTAGKRIKNSTCFVFKSIPVFHLHDVAVGPALVRVTVLGVLEQYAVHVRARVLEQLVGMVEDDERNLAVTQHTQFICFLHQAKLALCERHLQQNHNNIIARNSIWGVKHNQVIIIIIYHGRHHIQIQSNM